MANFAIYISYENTRFDENNFLFMFIDKNDLSSDRTKEREKGRESRESDVQLSQSSTLNPSFRPSVRRPLEYRVTLNVREDKISIWITKKTAKYLLTNAIVEGSTIVM
jgi:hypothetical protein